MQTDENHREPWPRRLLLAGFASSLVGIGLARFAYTPLIPAIVEAGWFGSDDAFYLGAANLAGYLAGALAGPRLSRSMPLPGLMRAMMVAIGISFVASFTEAPFWWFFLWRFVSGVGGGVLMALAAPSILPHVAQARRGRASGTIFTGVGIGAAIAGIAMPVLLGLGLGTAWLVLGGLSLALSVMTWNSWPSGRPTGRSLNVPSSRFGPDFARLTAVYGLNAAGLVPHMVFLVDYVARGTGAGILLGSAAWVCFGFGAACGPFAAGSAADRFGFAQTLRAALVIQILAIGSLAFIDSLTAIFLSAFVAGAAAPGIVPLVLGRVREVIEAPESQTRAWSTATAAFALLQAAGAYAFSALFAWTDSYTILFASATMLIALALCVDLAGRITVRPRVFRG